VVSGEAISRRLAAILAADVAGYSRLMERDEEGTLARLKSLRRDLIDPKIGDVIAEGEDIYGDGVNLAARLEALAEPGAVFVSNTVYDQIRDRLPISFEDLGEKRVKNIARPVRVYRARPAGEASAAIAPSRPAPDKPSIAVLPFENMSGDPEQDYFADGMVEEIITALSRIRSLFVIARNSSFTYKGQAV
jgi:adenylate cyclase